jgi:hypothetical protein
MLQSRKEQKARAEKTAAGQQPDISGTDQESGLSSGADGGWMPLSLRDLPDILPVKFGSIKKAPETGKPGARHSSAAMEDRTDGRPTQEKSRPEERGQIMLPGQTVKFN